MSVSAPILMLEGNNYVRWKLRMKSIFEANEVFCAIEQASDAKVEKKIEAKARMWLLSSLDDEHTRIVEDCESAKVIWDKLELE